MDYLWTPWRYAYMKQAVKGETPACIFCDALERHNDREMLIVHRGKDAFVILNRYPYTSGHVMIVPYTHVADLSSCEPAALSEMMLFGQKMEGIFRNLYSPQGMNLGMNIGRAAGAGVAGHIHLHALPRWFGDTNFMSAAGETRIHPEELSVTYDRVKAAFGS